MPTRPLISLAMIVRDGGDALARCLASARDHVDEIVVVDTGSTDDSVAVARSFDATVLHHVWEDDFSTARNVGLAAVGGRFVLVLDADEVLEAEVSLRATVRSHGVAGWFVPVFSPVGGGDHNEVAILRLFRASPRVRFRHPIHEQVLPDLERQAEAEGLRFEYLEGACIRHDGYRPEEMERRGKVERNLRLFRKALDQDPDNLYLWYKYADFLRSTPAKDSTGAHAVQRAYELLRHGALPGGRVPSYAGEILALCCASLLETESVEATLAFLEREPPARGGSPHYDYVAALAFEAAGRLDEALERLAATRREDPRVPWTARRPGIIGYQSELLEARIRLRRGDGVQAEQAARRALERHPESVAATGSLAEALWLQGQAGPALQVLTARLQEASGESGLWLLLGVFLLRLGHRDRAVECFRKAAPRERIAAVALAVLAPDDGEDLSEDEQADARFLVALRRADAVGSLPPRPAVQALAAALVGSGAD